MNFEHVGRIRHTEKEKKIKHKKVQNNQIHNVIVLLLLFGGVLEPPTLLRSENEQNCVIAFFHLRERALT